MYTHNLYLDWELKAFLESTGKPPNPLKGERGALSH